VSVSTDGEHFFTITPNGASSDNIREMFEWLNGVDRGLAPRFKALAGACGKTYVEEPLGKPGMRLELSLSRSGDEKRPFTMTGRVVLGWKQAKFGWLDQPEAARIERHEGVLRAVKGDLITEIDSDTGILRSLSIVDAQGKKLAAIERVRVETGVSFSREDFAPGKATRGGSAAWKKLCAGILAGIVLSRTAGLLPEDESTWNGETRRVLDDLYAAAADEVLEKFFGADAVEFIARAYTQVRAPKEKILRLARVSMEMQLRGTAEAAGAPEGPKGALLLAWREALKRRLDEKVVRPVLERLEELLSKRDTPWR
jgi:hypothetical protein